MVNKFVKKLSILDQDVKILRFKVLDRLRGRVGFPLAPVE